MLPKFFNRDPVDYIFDHMRRFRSQQNVRGERVGKLETAAAVSPGRHNETHEKSVGGHQKFLLPHVVDDGEPCLTRWALQCLGFSRRRRRAALRPSSTSLALLRLTVLLLYQSRASTSKSSLNSR